MAATIIYRKEVKRGWHAGKDIEIREDFAYLVMSNVKILILVVLDIRRLQPWEMYVCIKKAGTRDAVLDFTIM